MPASRRTQSSVATSRIWWYPLVDALNSATSSRIWCYLPVNALWPMQLKEFGLGLELGLVKKRGLFELLNFNFSEQNESLMWIWKHDDEFFDFSKQVMIGEKFNRCMWRWFARKLVRNSLIHNLTTWLVGAISGVMRLMLLTATMKAPGKRILKEQSTTWPGARHILHEHGPAQAREQFVDDD